MRRNGVGLLPAVAEVVKKRRTYMRSIQGGGAQKTPWWRGLKEKLTGPAEKYEEPRGSHHVLGSLPCHHWNVGTCGTERRKSGGEGRSRGENNGRTWVTDHVAESYRIDATSSERRRQPSIPHCSDPALSSMLPRCIASTVNIMLICITNNKAP